jgi:hypothetical protein
VNGNNEKEPLFAVLSGSYLRSDYVAHVEHPESLKLNTCGGGIEQ